MNNNELNFVYKVRHALNENLERLPPPTTERLRAARQIALAKKKKSSPLHLFALSRPFAGQFGSAMRDPLTWMGRVGALVPLLFVAAGLIGIYQFERQERISETAEIDAMVLTDELPLTAYMDVGFNAYLAERKE